MALAASRTGSLFGEIAVANAWIDHGSTVAPARETSPIASRLEALEPAEVTPAGESAQNAAASARHAEIYALADAGQDATEIAARLGRPSGEVALILALRTKS